MNFLEVNKNKKRDIVDTISAVYILETYINKKIKKQLQKFIKYDIILIINLKGELNYERKLRRRRIR